MPKRKTRSRRAHSAPPQQTDTGVQQGPTPTPGRGHSVSTAPVKLPTSGGAPLPKQDQQHLEKEFNADFSTVREFEGGTASKLGAVALTQKENIHYATGAKTKANRRHELTHVLQQRTGRVRANAMVGGLPMNNSPILEGEARRNQSGVTETSTEPGGPPLIQRSVAPTGAPVQLASKVGFELEDADWRSWKKVGFSPFSTRYYKTKDDKNGIRPLNKHEVLHQGTDFKLEADRFDEGGEALADIEFVTDPFTLNDSGQQKLVEALEGISDIYKDITGKAGRDHEEGEFLSSSDHHLNQSDILLSKGAGTARLNVQATQGVSLAKMPTLMTAMSTPVTGQDDPLAGVKVSLQLAVSGDKDIAQDRVLGRLAEAPQRAVKFSLAYLVRELDDNALGEDTASLAGFLATVISLLLTFQQAPLQGGLKTYLPLMQRNDFAAMYKKLPEAQRDVLDANKQTFIDAILAGVFTDATAGAPGTSDQVQQLRDNPLVGSHFILSSEDQKTFVPTQELPKFTTFTKASDGQRSFSPVHYGVLPPRTTIGGWVRAFMDGQNAVDTLTKAGFPGATFDGDVAASGDLQALIDSLPDDVKRLVDPGKSKLVGTKAFLAFRMDRLSDDQTSTLANYLRGTGEYGSDTKGGPPLFENRVIAPEFTDLQNEGNKLDMKTATSTLINYFIAARKLEEL
jgi:hypothetical protein